MDYETLKDQWNDVEERDGVRLSWNTFPSSRMVLAATALNQMYLTTLTNLAGSFAPGSPNRCSIHTFEGEGNGSGTIRASDLSMSSYPQSLLVQ